MLGSVALTFTGRRARSTAASGFAAGGMTIQHVPIDAPEEFSYRWVGHSHYLALHDLRLADGELLTDGSVVDRRRDLRGMMTFAPAGCRVWGWSIPHASGQSFTALYLDPRQMEEELAQKLRQIPSQAHVYFANAALRSTLEKMQWALTGVTPADSMYLESLCVVAVLELCVIQKERVAAAARPAGSLMRSNQRKIADYIETNLARDIGLNDLARLAGLSRFHFVRAFKKTTAESPYQYLLRRRIERARVLLTEGRLSVTEVARAVGFRDSTQFIRTFRTKVGVTPGKYRE